MPVKRMKNSMNKDEVKQLLQLLAKSFTDAQRVDGVVVGARVVLLSDDAANLIVLQLREAAMSL